MPQPKQANNFPELEANGLFYSLAIPAIDFIISTSLFDKIHISGIEEVISKKDNALIFVPPHYSRFDFVVLPVELYKRGVGPLRILARKDVLQGIFGKILRMLGGIEGPGKESNPQELRRVSKRLQEIVSRQLPLELFAQMGRTYNGKISPETDLETERFKPIITAVRSLRSPVILYPVVITYEAIPEIEGYAILEEAMARGNPKITEGVDSHYLKKAMLSEKRSGVFIDFLEGIDLWEAYAGVNTKTAAIDLGKRIHCAWLSNFRPVPADIVSYSILKARKPDSEVNASELPPNFTVSADKLLDQLYTTREMIRRSGLERDNLQGLTFDKLLAQGMAALYQKKKGKVVKGIVVEEDMNTYLVKQPHVVAFYANRLEQALGHAREHK